MLDRRPHPLLACLLACGPVGPDVSTSDAQTTAASGSGPDGGWQALEQDGDIIVELCGAACTTYLNGAFTDLELHMFCEAA